MQSRCFMDDWCVLFTNVVSCCGIQDVATAHACAPQENRRASASVRNNLHLHLVVVRMLECFVERYDLHLTVSYVIHSPPCFSTRLSCNASSKSANTKLVNTTSTTNHPPTPMHNSNTIVTQARRSRPPCLTLQLPPFLHQQQLVPQRLFASARATWAQS